MVRGLVWRLFVRTRYQSQRTGNGGLPHTARRFVGKRRRRRLPRRVSRRQPPDRLLLRHRVPLHVCLTRAVISSCIVTPFVHMRGQDAPAIRLGNCGFRIQDCGFYRTNRTDLSDSSDKIRIPQSAFRNPHSAFRIPQSAIRNPQSAIPRSPPFDRA